MRAKSPFIIGVAYLVGIPLFAAIYSWWLPTDFYHATARLEQETAVSESKAQPFLQWAMTEWLAAISQPDADKLLVVTPPVATDDGIVAHMWFRWNATADGAHQTEEAAVKSANVKIELATLVAEVYKTHIRVPIRLTNVPRALAGRLAQRFNTPEVRIGPIGNVVVQADATVPQRDDAIVEAYLAVSPDMFETFRRLYAARIGVAPPDGRYARFFYFSAVTLTTTGFGDIVPTTARARVVVGFESIYGVVMVGLFLNSLASHFRPDASIKRANVKSRKKT
jgi:hypothetical protein